MFKIDTRSARTDLYGIGKGGAQVIDLSPLREQAKYSAIAEERKAAAKQKQDEDRYNDIQKQMMLMGNVKIMPRDQPLIADKANAVREYVIKNIDKIQKGDVEANMGFQQLYGDYKTSADLSQNSREHWEQVGMDITKNPQAYRPESVQSHFDFAHPDNAGNWTYDDTKIKKNFDLYEDLRKNVRPILEDIAQGGTVGYVNDDGTKTVVTKDSLNDDQVKGFLKDRLKSSQVFEEAAYELTKEDESVQKRYDGNVVDYYVDKMLPYSGVSRNKSVTSNAGGSGSGGSGSSTKIGVSGVLTKDADGRDVLSFDTDKPVDNPYNTYIDPSTGKTVEGKPLRLVYNKDNKTAPEMIIAVKPNKEQGIKGGEMVLGWEEAQKTLSNKYGLENPYDVIYGNEPKNWRVNRPSQVENKSNEPAKKDWTKYKR